MNHCYNIRYLFELYIKVWHLTSSTNPKQCYRRQIPIHFLFTCCIETPMNKIWAERFNPGLFKTHMYLGIWGCRFQGWKLSSWNNLDLLTLTKVICTKYSKHWLYTVAHTIECVCSKMNNSWFNPWFSFYFSSLYPAPYIKRYMC